MKKAQLPIEQERFPINLYTDKSKVLVDNDKKMKTYLDCNVNDEERLFMPWVHGTRIAQCLKTCMIYIYVLICTDLIKSLKSVNSIGRHW